MSVIPASKVYNTQIIQKALIPYINKPLKIKCNLGRNKYETIQVKIIKLYGSVFLVEDINGIIKSFSYADIITKTIKITE